MTFVPQQYHNIKLPSNPTEIIEKLGLSIFSLQENAADSYILGYCRDEESIISISDKESYNQLSDNKHYYFGYIPYNEKNQFLPKAQSTNKPFHQCSNSIFFLSLGTFILKNGIALFYGTNQEYKLILAALQKPEKQLTETKDKNRKIELHHQTSATEYVESVKEIKKHIQNGEIYEMNYCITAEAKGEALQTAPVYSKLKRTTRAPFSAYIKIRNINILSASPERFIKKSGQIITSQPIKGTIKRGLNSQQDKQLQSKLLNDQKELSENIMIVDLVRNDMSKIASASTVKVKELCKLYSFKTVHQLISTVQCQVKANTKLSTILQSLFPMGSMTGAPKLKASQLIEKYENFDREIYSGSIGYISPNNSFDFNVVIRSIIHNKKRNTTSISVGSAITIKSNPHSEYQECLLKLSAIQSALN